MYRTLVTFLHLLIFPNLTETTNGQGEQPTPDKGIIKMDLVSLAWYGSFIMKATETYRNASQRGGQSRMNLGGE